MQVITEQEFNEIKFARTFESRKKARQECSDKHLNVIFVKSREGNIYPMSSRCYHCTAFIQWISQ